MQGEMRKRKGKKEQEGRGSWRKALGKKEHVCKKEEEASTAPQLVAKSPV